jgi:molecular chaperone GrpE
MEKTAPAGTEPKDPANPEAREREDQKKKKKKDDLVERLEESLAAKEAIIKQLEDDMLYLKADFENFKKLKARERQDTLKYGNEVLIRDILPVIDNLERALEHASQGDNTQGIQEGVHLILADFLKVLEKNGVTRVEALGKLFDPNLHEAFYQEERGDVEPDTVVGEFQKGYQLYGRLLRPTVVSIAKKGGAEGD